MTIRKELPHNVTIQVTERTPAAYVEYLSGAYVTLDGDGLVLEVTSALSQSLPVVTGLDVQAITVGKPLPVDNQAKLAVVEQLVQLFQKYQLESDVIRVDVSDPQAVHLLWHHIDVLLGDLTDCDNKINWMQTYLQTLSGAETIRGTLDLSGIDGPTKAGIFTLLT